MESTHTTLRMGRAEMLELLSKMNVTTTLVRLADDREDHTGVCGAFSVRRTPLERLYTLTIDLAWGRG
jgi:hypothetical protein